MIMTRAGSAAALHPNSLSARRWRASIALAALLSTGMMLGACSDPYSPGQRAVGGGLLGAGGGAALGAIAGGGHGAAIGALAGGALGAAGGAATTPSRPRQDNGGYSNY